MGIRVSDGKISLVLKGMLTKFKVRYDDGSEEYIDDIKPKATEFVVVRSKEELDAQGSWHTPGGTYTGDSDVLGSTKAIYYIVVYYDI